MTKWRRVQDVLRVITRFLCMSAYVLSLKREKHIKLSRFVLYALMHLLGKNVH